MLATGPQQICTGYSAGAEVAIQEKGPDFRWWWYRRNPVGWRQQHPDYLPWNFHVYHQHVQKSPEIVYLWRSRDRIPRGDNIGCPSSHAMVCDQHIHLDSEPKSAYTWSFASMAGWWLGRRRPNGTVIQLIYTLFSQDGKKFGYLINGSKSWLI